MLRARESAAAPTSMPQGAPLRYCITKLRSAGQNLYFLRGTLIRRRERRFTVAEWQYRIERIDLNPETDTDDQLGKILREYGQQGWELVQVLHWQEMPGDPRCRLIFKTEKPLD